MSRVQPAAAASLALLALLGGLFGLVGAFLVPLRVGGTPVPVSAILAFGGNVALGLAGARAAGDRLGALPPAAGWFGVVVLASMRGPGGDLVLPGTLGSYVFLLAGAVGSAAAFTLAKSRRSATPRSRGGR
jgi:hypothetical protein